jgi:hypothetical protein
LQDDCDVAAINSTSKPPETVVHPPSHDDPQLHEDSDDTLTEFEQSLETIKEHEFNHLKMLESHSQASLKSCGEMS